MAKTFRLALMLALLVASWRDVLGDERGQQGSPKRPNILFVFSDDHASHAIGAYGGWLAGRAPTPNIDRLADQGMLFENCFCTNSICGPSRAVILTGLHSHRNGFRQNSDRFDGAQPTFPKILRSVGYQTAVIGKWHLGSDPTGFDHWCVLPDQGDYYNPDLVSASGSKRYPGHVTDVITGLSIDWLRKGRDPTKPFLLMCQHKAPHRTWMPQLRRLEMFADEQLPEPPTLFDRHADDAPGAREQEMEIVRHMTFANDLKAPPPPGAEVDAPIDPSTEHNLARMTPAQRAAWDSAYAAENAALWRSGLAGEALVRWKLQRYLKDYLRCVAGVDESLGRLRAQLESLGLDGNTVVIYSSDQGFFLGDHGWFDKRWMYEHSLRMPLVVSWPGVTEAGSRSRYLVQNLDFAPTLLDLAGAPIPAAMQGRSLAPILRGEPPADWRDAVYYHYYEHPGSHNVARHRGVRTDRLKLIHFYELDAWEFYDLAVDPDELFNRYAVPEHAQQIATLKLKLQALRQEVGDLE